MLTCMCNNFTSPSKFFSSWTVRLILYICPIFYRKCHKSQSLRNASFPWCFPLSNLLCRISVVLFHLIVYPYHKTAFWVVDRKSRFWRTLETNLDFTATHGVNLYFRVDMKSTLISKYSSDNFGDNLDLKGKSWIKPCNQSKQFLCTLKSRLISKGNLNISDVNNFTTFSQCLTREIWIRYEY